MTTPAALAARIVVRHPHLARPVALALALVEAGHVSGNDIHTQVINAERTIVYHQDYNDYTGDWTCNCPAYQYRPYKVGDPRRPVAHCKHTIARAIADRAGSINGTFTSLRNTSTRENQPCSPYATA